MKLLILTWKSIRLFMFYFLKFTVLSNRKYYYSKYYGSDHTLILILKNIITPARLFDKIQYGLVPILPRSWRRGSAAPTYSPDEEILKSVEKLRSDGFVCFPEAHPELADYILKKYETFFNSTKDSSHYQDLILNEIDQDTLSLMVNEKYLKIMSEYYNGRQPYLRAAGTIKVTKPTFNTPHTRERLDKKLGYNTNWHYDTVNMLQVHFLLHDLTPEDTHMILARHENKVHRVNITPDDYWYSDEYADKHFKSVPICGKKGTLFLWDSNAPHRAQLIKEKPRAFIQFLYSPGNYILTTKEEYGSAWSITTKNLNLNLLQPISRNALQYIIDDRPASEKTQGNRKLREGFKFEHKEKKEFEVSNF